MSFLKNIFKKKVGGTLVGNLIRIGANKLTNGILGNGAGILQPPVISPITPTLNPSSDALAQKARQDLIDSGINPDTGQPFAKTGGAAAGALGNILNGGNATGVTSPVGGGFLQSVKDFFTKGVPVDASVNKGSIIGIGIVVIGAILLVYFLFKKKGKK